MVTLADGEKGVKDKLDEEEVRAFEVAEKGTSNADTVLTQCRLPPTSILTPCVKTPSPFATSPSLARSQSTVHFAVRSPHTGKVVASIRTVDANASQLEMEKVRRRIDLAYTAPSRF